MMMDVMKPHPNVTKAVKGMCDMNVTPKKQTKTTGNSELKVLFFNEPSQYVQVSANRQLEA